MTNRSEDLDAINYCGVEDYYNWQECITAICYKLRNIDKRLNMLILSQNIKAQQENK